MLTPGPSNFAWVVKYIPSPRKKWSDLARIVRLYDQLNSVKRNH